MDCVRTKSPSTWADRVSVAIPSLGATTWVYELSEKSTMPIWYVHGIGVATTIDLSEAVLKVAFLTRVYPDGS